MAGELSGRADSCQSAARPAYTTRDLALASPAGAVSLMGDMEATNRAVLLGIAASHAHVIGVAVSLAGHHHAGSAAQVGSGVP